MRYLIEEIWVDHDAADEPLTREVLRKVPAAKVFVSDEFTTRQRDVLLSADPLRRGKRILRLMKHRGAFVKPCPGTPEYVCCGLEILHIGQGCPMDCRYCALQAYLNRPVIEVFVNLDDLFDGLRQHLTDHPDVFHRICTGEFADSLALDPLTGLAERLVECVSSHGNASIELKTKTDYVEPLLGIRPRGAVVVSFSVNSTSVTSNDERRAATLAQRLTAAAHVEARGYRVGFHFDPIIPLPGWERAYADTVDRIYCSVPARSIAWISLGVLRFVPELKSVATDRFGPIRYYHDGFVRGLDGKSRLPVERRIRIYRHVADRIRRHDPDARVYLCMESPHVWKASLGMEMKCDRDLARYLDEGVTQQPLSPGKLLRNAKRNRSLGADGRSEKEE